MNLLCTDDSLSWCRLPEILKSKDMFHGSFFFPPIFWFCDFKLRAILIKIHK